MRSSSCSCEADVRGSRTASAADVVKGKVLGSMRSFNRRTVGRPAGGRQREERPKTPSAKAPLLMDLFRLRLGADVRAERGDLEKRSDADSEMPLPINASFPSRNNERRARSPRTPQVDMEQDATTLNRG